MQHVSIQENGAMSASREAHFMEISLFFACGQCDGCCDASCRCGCLCFSRLCRCIGSGCCVWNGHGPGCLRESSCGLSFGGCRHCGCGGRDGRGSHRGSSDCSCWGRGHVARRPFAFWHLYQPLALRICHRGVVGCSTPRMQIPQKFWSHSKRQLSRIYPSDFFSLLRDAKSTRVIIAQHSWENPSQLLGLGWGPMVSAEAECRQHAVAGPRGWLHELKSSAFLEAWEARTESTGALSYQRNWWGWVWALNPLRQVHAWVHLGHLRFL